MLKVQLEKLKRHSGHHFGSPSLEKLGILLERAGVIPATFAEKLEAWVIVLRAYWLVRKRWHRLRIPRNRRQEAATFIPQVRELLQAL